MPDVVFVTNIVVVLIVEGCCDTVEEKNVYYNQGQSFPTNTKIATRKTTSSMNVPFDGLGVDSNVVEAVLAAGVGDV